MDFDEAEMDMIRRGDMLGPTLGAKVATALETLQRERDEAREALRFYAAPENYKGAFVPGGLTDHGTYVMEHHINLVRSDGGKIARAALSPKEAEE